jgi:hypothetical protein
MRAMDAMVRGVASVDPEADGKAPLALAESVPAVLRVSDDMMSAY